MNDGTPNLALSAQPAPGSLAVPADFSSILEFCKHLVLSGLLPKGVDSPQKAAVILLKGRELGIGPMTSFDKIVVIHGRPGLSPELMLSLAIQRIPGFKHEILEESADRARIKFQRDGFAPYTAEFTMDMADAMSTQENGKTIRLSDKYNWRTMPETMLFWRCLAKGLRRYCPDLNLTYSIPEVEDFAGNDDEKAEDLMPRAVEAKVETVTAPQEMPKDNATFNFPDSGAAKSEPKAEPKPDDWKPPVTDPIAEAWRKVAGIGNLVANPDYWVRISTGKDKTGKPFKVVRTQAEAEERMDFYRSKAWSLAFVFAWQTRAIMEFRPKAAADAVAALTAKGLKLEEIEAAVCGGEDFDLWLLRDAEANTKVIREIAEEVAAGTEFALAVDGVMGNAEF